MKSIFRLLVLTLLVSAFTVSCLTATTIAEKPKAELSICDFDVGIDLESVVINNLLEVVNPDYLFIEEVSTNIGYAIENGNSTSNDSYFSQITKAQMPNEINHYSYYERTNYDIYKLARDLIT